MRGFTINIARYSHDLRVHPKTPMSPKERVIFFEELFKASDPGPPQLMYHRRELPNCLYHGGTELLSYGNLWKDDNRRAHTVQSRVTGIDVNLLYKETVDQEGHIRYMTDQGDGVEFPQVCKKQRFLD